MGVTRWSSEIGEQRAAAQLDQAVQQQARRRSRRAEDRQGDAAERERRAGPPPASSDAGEAQRPTSRLVITVKKRSIAQSAAPTDPVRSRCWPAAGPRARPRRSARSGRRRDPGLQPEAFHARLLVAAPGASHGKSSGATFPLLLARAGRGNAMSESPACRAIRRRPGRPEPARLGLSRSGLFPGRDGAADPPGLADRLPRERHRRTGDWRTLEILGESIIVIRGRRRRGARLRQCLPPSRLAAGRRRGGLREAADLPLSRLDLCDRRPPDRRAGPAGLSGARPGARSA